MIFEPRAGQPPIVDFVSDHARCNVFGPVGVGKTAAIIWVLNNFRLVDRGPVLIAAPPRVARTTWPDEIAKYDNIDLPVLPLYGSPGARENSLTELGKYAVTTISYELLPWLIEHYGKKWPFRSLIADESSHLQSYRGRNGGVRAQAIGRVAHTFIKRWVNLDGTPGLGGEASLWGPQWFVDAGSRLGSNFGKFQRRFFFPTYRSQYPEWKPQPGALNEIKELLADCSVSVEPPTSDKPIYVPHFIDLPAHGRKAYDAMEKAFFVELAEGKTIEAVNAGAKSGKLLQIANGAAYLDWEEDDSLQHGVAQPRRPWQDIHSEKLEVLDSILNETHEPVLIAYHFRPDLYRLQMRYKHARVFDSNPETIHAWNRGEIGALLVHAQSCSEGTNLQDGGRTIIFYGRNWGARNRVQLIERIGPTRQLQAGHPRAVFVHDIVARDTVDEDVLASYTSGLTIMETLLKRMQRNA